MLSPCSQWRKSSPTRIRQASASSRDDQPEVVAQHALVGAAMVEDVLARGEDREHRRRHPRDLAHHLGRPGAHLDAELRLEAVAVEEERLPAVVVGDLDLILRDLLEVGQRLAVLEHALELAAIVSQLASISAIQGKRSFPKKVASPTSDRFPMNSSIGASTRSPKAIVSSTVRSTATVASILPVGHRVASSR